MSKHSSRYFGLICFQHILSSYFTYEIPHSIHININFPTLGLGMSITKKWVFTYLYMFLNDVYFRKYNGIYFVYFGNNRSGLYLVIFFGNKSVWFFWFRYHFFRFSSISVFFNFWLVKSRLPNQNKSVGNRSIWNIW